MQFSVLADQELTRERQCGEGLTGIVYAGQWRDMAVAIKEVIVDSFLLLFVILSERGSFIC